MSLELKNKKQFLQISVTAFVLSLVPQILSAVINLVERSMLIDPDYEIRPLLSFINNWMSFTIAPILIFVVFYFIGKKPNLTFELKPILLALLIGNVASLFISSVIRMAVEMAISVFAILGSMLGLTLILLPVFFLAALAGLSIGYIRRKKSTSIAESELS